MDERQRAWGAIAGGALMFGGSFLPWVTVTTIFGTLSRAGVDGNGDGIISAGLGIAAAGIGVALLNRVSRPLSVALTIVAVLGALLVYVDVTDIQRSLGDLGTDAALASVGIGLWVVGAGAALSLVMGLEGLRGAKNPLRPAPSFSNGALDSTKSGAPLPAPTGQQPLDHGIYRCTTGAKIPRAQQREGEPCPFCGRTLSTTPTVTNDGPTRHTRWWQVALVVVVMVVGLLIFYGTDLIETLGL